MRYRLRTLITLMAVLPPVLAGTWLVWQSYGDAILDWIGNNHLHL